MYDTENRMILREMWIKGEIKKRAQNRSNIFGKKKYNFHAEDLERDILKIYKKTVLDHNVKLYNTVPENIAVTS